MEHTEKNAMIIIPCQPELPCLSGSKYGLFVKKTSDISQQFHSRRYSTIYRREEAVEDGDLNDGHGDT
jgi:hypothetical protein